MFAQPNQQQQRDFKLPSWRRDRDITSIVLSYCDSAILLWMKRGVVLQLKEGGAAPRKRGPSAAAAFSLARAAHEARRARATPGLLFAQVLPRSGPTTSAKDSSQRQQQPESTRLGATPGCVPSLLAAPKCVRVGFSTKRRSTVAAGRPKRMARVSAKTDLAKDGQFLQTQAASPVA